MGFCLFLSLIIWTLITKVWFAALIFSLVAVFHLFAYNYFRTKGFFDKIFINSDGITFRVGCRKEKTLIQWQNIKDINGMKLKIVVYLNGSDLRNIYTDNAEGILNAIDKLQIKRDRFCND